MKSATIWPLSNNSTSLDARWGCTVARNQPSRSIDAASITPELSSSFVRKFGFDAPPLKNLGLWRADLDKLAAVDAVDVDPAEPVVAADVFL